MHAQKGNREKRKKNVFAVISVNSACVLKGLLFCQMEHYPMYRSRTLKLRRLPRSEIVGLPWGGGRGRIIGKPLLWMFGHTTQWSGEKLAALGASLRPGLCSFPQERLETHALAHEAHLPNHF